jgi:electron transfer flavoprotein alpha subunit
LLDKGEYMAGIWIISENRVQTLELLNIGREIAAKMGTRVSTLLSQDREQAQEYIKDGADEVLLLPPIVSEQTFDAYIPVIVEEAKKDDPDLILVSATARGKDMAARIAARLDTGLCSSCIALNFDEDNKTLVMERLAYGGAAVQKVMCSPRWQPFLRGPMSRPLQRMAGKDRSGSFRRLRPQW